MSIDPPSSRAADPALTAAIDASCRLPVLFLFAKAAGWLVISSVLSLIASVKIHAPYLLSAGSWLTYGRLQAAAADVFIYGFAIQAGLGIAIWLLVRLGGTPLVQPGLVWVGASFWNLGVAIGLLGILMGDLTGYPWLQMPGYASPILFAAYFVIGVCALLTYHRRQTRTLYPSQWFLLAALFWFPWIYSAANLLLIAAPVRGVMQAVAGWWYVANLGSVWMACVGLAAIFYFIPKLTGRPLHSYYLALFAFWTLLLFAPWSGIPAGAPVPAWIPGLGTVCSMLSLLPLLAVALMCDGTLAGAVSRVRESLPLKFVFTGALLYVLAGVIGAIDSLPVIARLVEFTWFTAARTQLWLYGFFAMTVFGCVYYIGPKISGMEWPAARLPKAHFWLSVIGLLLYFIPLTVGGVQEGRMWSDPAVAFQDATQAGLRMFRASTLGELLMTFGNLLLAVNLCWLVCRSFCACCCSLWPVVRNEPAEAKG